MKRNLLLLTVLIFLMTAHTTALAQDTDETPPPLPSKTPTPTIQEAEQLEPSTDVPLARFEIEDPFIQADLSILSGNVQRPNGMFWHNGMLYVSCNGDWTIYEINATDGATITYLWGIRNAHTLVAETDSAGDLNLWIPDFQTNSLNRIYRQQIQTVSEGLSGPWGITTAGDTFLVTNLLSNSITQVGRDGTTQDQVEGLRSPTGIVVDGDLVYVANNGSARRAIEWFDMASIEGEDVLDTSEEGAVNSLVSGLQSTTGVVLGPDRYLYFAYSLGTRGVVGRVDPTVCREKGGCTNDEVEIVLYTDLAAPLSGLTISPDLNLYVHTIFSPDIYYVDLNQTTETVLR